MKTFNFFKKMVVFLLVVTFVVPTTIFLHGCSSNPNYNGFSIQNWDSYSAFGAGVVNSSKAQAFSSEKSAVQSQHKKNRLIGKTHEGSFEQIKFVNQSGKKADQTMNVVNFKSSSLMTFVQFANRESEIGSFYGQNDYKSEPLYVIDNKTGKIYYLGDTFRHLIIACYGDNYNSADSAYLLGYSKNDADNKYGGNIYKLSFRDNKLEVKKILDLTGLTHWTFLVDKFNNVFIGDFNFGENPSLQGSCYYLYNNGKIKNFSHNVWKSLNEIVYCNNQFVNSIGELEDTDFVPEKQTFLQNQIIYAQDNVSYYYLPYSYHTNTGYYTSETEVYSKVYKVTIQNAIEYTVEKIDLEDYTSTYAVSQTKIYFLNESELFYVDIETGSKHAVETNNLILKTIYQDTLGNIIYEGIDANTNNITGMITPDGTITESVTYNDFMIIYLEPIN